MSITYRPEIDGLRALSVLAVVIYHAEFLINGKNVLKGGYIGVDIFFVISGYLIGLILLKDLQQQKFSFADFYERRARRILPALFLVMIATFPVFWMHMQPKEMEEYAGSVLSSLAFGSNIWFWLEDNYWAAPSELKPFLHTWTLSVEEQFYVIFPIALLVIWKYELKHFLHIFIGIFIVSLLIAHIGSKHYAEATFYLLPARGWELVAGVILAKLELDRGRSNCRLLNLTMPGIGVVLIMCSFLFFDSNTRHPSFNTLVPVLGAMLLIWYSKKGEIITNILSSKLFVGIGLISYSLYLWHYPIFAFNRIQNNFNTDIERLESIVLALFLSVFSFYIIEKPMRNRLLVPVNSLIIGLLITFISLVILFGHIYITDGAKYRKSVAGSFLGKAYWEKNAGHRELFSTYQGCWLSKKGLNYENPFEVCKEKESHDTRPIMVIGDSHIAGLIPGLINYFGRETIAQRVVNGCRPYINYMNDHGKERDDKLLCEYGLLQAFKDISSINPKLILIGGNYRLNETKHLKELFNNELSEFKSRTIIVGPFPRFGNINKKIMNLNQNDQSSNYVPDYLEARSDTFYIEKQIKKFSEELDIDYISIVNNFCKSGKCLLKFGSEPDDITSWDGSHITHKASHIIVENNINIIEQYLK